MEIGLALPQMAANYSAHTTVEWARAADEGPFSSISAGERVTFSNPEMVASLAACAAVTERVRIFANLWVLPQHPMPMVAQCIGTLDQLSNGRLDVAVGVGAREDDYRALGAPWPARHQRLDDLVRELKSLLAGTPPFEGAEAVGPSCVQRGGPRILAGAMGPKAIARAAQWADGISGFSIGADQAEMARGFALADRAWASAGRPVPRKVSGCFFALGVNNAQEVLTDFATRYLGFLGPELARAVANTAQVAGSQALLRALDSAKQAGCDEFILVPATAETGCHQEAAEVVSTWLA
jgi:alkanesulfonate monooxygenase SsuD/methylene tetrahydromethanopterin reductase-like flavin-dependent oxidoreductase (luciferase family)